MNIVRWMTLGMVAAMAISIKVSAGDALSPAATQPSATQAAGEAPAATQPEFDPAQHAAATQARAEAEKRLEAEAEKGRAPGKAMAKLIWAASGGAAWPRVSQLEMDITATDPVYGGPQQFRHSWNIKTGEYTLTGPVKNGTANVKFNLQKPDEAATAGVTGQTPDADALAKIAADFRVHQAGQMALILLPFHLQDAGVTVRQLPAGTPGGPANPHDESGLLRGVVQEEVTFDGTNQPADKYVLGVDANSHRIVWSRYFQGGKGDGDLLLWNHYQQFGPLFFPTEFVTDDGVLKLQVTRIRLTLAK